MARISFALLAVLTCYMFLSTAPTHRESRPRALPPSETRATLGGVAVTEFRFPSSDNWTQAADNLQFRLEVANAYASKGMIIGLFSGSQKYAEAYIDPATTKEFAWRTMWPIDTVKRDVQLMYSGTSGWELAASDSTRSQVGIFPGTKIGKIIFYHLKADDDASEVSLPFDPRMIVDNLTDYGYDIQTTNSIDAINTQCASNGRWQYRTERVLHNVNVPEGCTDIRWNGPSSSRSCHDWIDNFDDLVEQTAIANGYDADDYIHLLFVRSFARWDSSENSYRHYGGYFPGSRPLKRRKWVVIVANAGEEETTGRFAHEIGHLLQLCHPDEALCNQAGSSHGCDTDPPKPASERNLMCGAIAGGRLLTPSQCSTMGSSTRLKDWL